MTLKRLLEIIQFFAEQFPEAMVLVSLDDGGGGLDHEPLLYVQMATPGDPKNPAFIYLEPRQ